MNITPMIDGFVVGDEFFVMFGRRATQKVRVHHLRAPDRVYVEKWLAASKRWTRPIRYRATELQLATDNADAIRAARAS